VPEAEAVLIEAAERIRETLRGRQTRGPGSAGHLGAFRAARGRLGVLLWACFERELPVVATDPAPRPGWLARRLGGLPPWRLAPEAPIFSDGHRLFLPRALLEAGADPEAGAALRIAALGLAARLERGSLLVCPEDPVARDLFWSAEGAVVGRVLAERLPGLAPALDRLRREALARRPDPAGLRPAERHVERWVRALLASGPPPPVAEEDAPGVLVAWAWAEARRTPEPSGYRGTAPVLHWGVPRSELLAEAPAPGADLHGAETPPPPEGRSRRLARRLEIRREPDPEDEAPAPILLAYEDGHLAVQDPAGLRRARDRGLEDEADLEALAEELERSGEMTRVREPGRSGEILEAEEPERHTSVEGAAPRDAGGVAAFVYAEWDCRVGAYRPGHCRVEERPAPAGDPAWAREALTAHAPLLRAVRRRFEALRPRRERRGRQLDGDDLDLDAVVAAHADRRAGHPPDERLYSEARPRRRDVAVAFLLDASGSTDAWVSGRERVLDVAKRASLVLGEALRALGDRHAMYAFSGEGPRGVRVWRLRGFREPAGETPARIAGLAPDRYTRLGAALRHATAAVAGEPAHHRLLLLLSDGKPNDEDVYEGRYGIEDTRQAVVEARARGVFVFCLTIDREGPAYLPRIFGPHGYAVLPRAEVLPERLVELYRQLAVAGPGGGR